MRAVRSAPLDAERRKSLEETTRWDPGTVEQRVFDGWMEGGWFHPPATGSPEENFSISIPPPNVTGALHMGHALNGTIQDALIRINRMRGRNTLWVLGTDHAGIGTQAVVEKELAAEGSSRHDLGREAFTERVWEWKAQYGSTIVEQFKRLGASCDYERERFTLDEGYVEAVYRVFVSLYEKGWIYRDNYMVNWDPGLQSAISDLEIEQREVTDTLYEIAYPLKDGEGELVVATVRPETMLADTAVAVNPGDDRYSDAVGKTAELPLVGRELPVIADEHVDVEFGTGALKITPGHDPADFEIGQKQGLEAISVIGEDGLITDAAPERFQGMKVDDAREAVVAELREQDLIRDEQPYTHSVPFSHRSGERVEPLISLQWFCRMDEMAKPAMEVVRDGRVRFVPADPHTKVYLDWLERIRPWCISRQLWWGHRLPVWYRGDPEDPEVHVGTDPPDGDGWEQESDVLDTWFSSALWPFATLGWPDADAPEFKAYFPTDVLSTARDIIFLWVARMVMTSLEFTGEVPFSTVNIHSVIQAPDGRRMSKSLGTGIDPLDEIEVHGADALRFGLLAMSSAQDVRYSEARVKQGRDLANKMWNASRLILLNAEDGAEPGPAGERGGGPLDRLAAAARDRLGRRLDRGLRLLPRGPGLVRVLLVGAVRLVSGDSQGASLRRRPRSLGDAAVGARAGAGAGPPDDAVRDRGDLLLPAVAVRRGPGRPRVSRGRRFAARRGGRARDRRRDRAHAGAAALAGSRRRRGGRGAGRTGGERNAPRARGAPRACLLRRRQGRGDGDDRRHRAARRPRA